MPPWTRASVSGDVDAASAGVIAMGRKAQLGHGSRWNVARTIGLTSAVLVLLVAVLGPSVAPYDPFAITGGSLDAPSRAHAMGTDALGRDVYSAVLYGARTSLLIAAAVSAIAMLVGTAIGLVGGYQGDWVDDVLSHVTELFQVIPRFFFVITTIAMAGPGAGKLILVIGLTSWPTMARVVRGETIATRHREFVLAAQALGASPWRIMWRQLLPNVLPSTLAALGPLFGQVLLLEATLGFLGLGDPATMSWGMMAAQAQGFLRAAWWLAFYPGLAITLAVLGVNLLADSWAPSSAAV